MPIRRAAALFLVLALVVGSASASMPRASAAPGPDFAGSVDDGDCCGDCEPAALSVADCGAICLTPAAVDQPVVAVARVGPPSPWNWNNESVRTPAVEPATAPPRI